MEGFRLAEVLTETDEITGKILRIIKDASKKIYLVSPYVQFDEWPKLKDALGYALREKKVKLTFIIRKPKKVSKNDPIDQLREFLETSTIYLLPDLHSKVYSNEFEALITSMNMHQYSLKNNQEIGVFFNKENEPQLEAIDQHIQYLISIGEEYLTTEKKKQKRESIERSPPNKLSEAAFYVLSKGTKWLKVISSEGYENKIAIVNAPGLKVGKSYQALVKKYWKETPFGFEVEFTEIQNLQKITGYCIICGKNIDLDPDKPLCKTCYFDNIQYRWNIFGNLCHKCGVVTSGITDSKPLCRECYFEQLG